jgi:hypothetical protein
MNTSKNSTRAPSSLKPKLPELSLLGWLAEDPANRFAIESEHTFSCYEKLAPRPDGLRPVRKMSDHLADQFTVELTTWFGGKIAWKSGPLSEQGFFLKQRRVGAYKDGSVATFNELVADVYIPGDWILSSIYIAATENGVAWWNEHGRAIHAAMLAKVAEKREQERAAERRAVFGWTMQFDRKVPERIEDILPQGMQLPLPRLSGLRPMFTARIVKETPERLYLEDIRPINPASSIISMVCLKVHGKLQYVDRNRLVLDHATEDDVIALKEFDRAQQEDHNERCRRAAEEIEPILKRYFDGTIQNEAEHADRISDLLAKLRKKG